MGRTVQMFSIGDRKRRIRRAGTLLAILSAMVLSGCVSATLDMDDRGSRPIPQLLLAEMRKQNMKPSDPILVRIFKKESELEVWKRRKGGEYALLKTYPMCRWSGKLGPKTKQGDRQAPEGFYNVGYGRLNPQSKYYLSFDIGYPNRLERALGHTGSALMVHGACSSAGCYAISDEHVAEVYALAREALKGGQRSFQVQAFPFRMTPENMAAYHGDPNFDFWLDLKRGYDEFEVTRKPPTVTFCDARYRFGEIATGSAPDNPKAACPAFEQPDMRVAARTDADLAKMKSLVEDGYSATYAYQDGGMHINYRKLLATRGPEYLARMTSSKAVPVSRPRAALEDPYKPKR